MREVKSFQFRIAYKNIPQENWHQERTIFTAELLPVKSESWWRASWVSKSTGATITYDYPEKHLLKALANRDWILVDDGDEE